MISLFTTNMASLSSRYMRQSSTRRKAAPKPGLHKRGPSIFRLQKVDNADATQGSAASEAQQQHQHQQHQEEAVPYQHSDESSGSDVDSDEVGGAPAVNKLRNLEALQGCQIQQWVERRVAAEERIQGLRAAARKAVESRDVIDAAVLKHTASLVFGELAKRATSSKHTVHTTSHAHTHEHALIKLCTVHVLQERLALSPVSQPVALASLWRFASLGLVVSALASPRVAMPACGALHALVSLHQKAPT